jgi:hypothetical protein
MAEIIYFPWMFSILSRHGSLVRERFREAPDGGALHNASMLDYDFGELGKER